MAFISMQTEALSDLISELFTKRNNNWNNLLTNIGKVDTASQKVIIGDESLGAGAEAIAVGYGANAAGTRSMAVGYGANAAGLEAVAIGYGTNAASEYNVAIGRTAAAPNTSGVAIGYSANADAAYATAVGRHASVAHSNGSALGYLATVTGVGVHGVQIGRGENTTTKRIQLGHASYANTVHVVGTLSKGAGTFEISHPHPAKKNTHDLRHFFVETNNYGGLIYNFRDVEVTGGTGQLTMPEYFGWLANPATIDIFCQPQKHFGRAYAEIEIDQAHADKPATLTITADTDGKYAIMVVAERNDPMISEMKARQTHLAEGGMVKEKGRTWDGETNAVQVTEVSPEADDKDIEEAIAIYMAPAGQTTEIKPEHACERIIHPKDEALGTIRQKGESLIKTACTATDIRKEIVKAKAEQAKIKKDQQEAEAGESRQEK